MSAVAEMTTENRAKLAAFNIQVVNKRVAALEGDNRSRQLRRVVFDDNVSLDCDALFFNLGTDTRDRST